MNQSELEANTCNRRQARENAWERVGIGLSLGTSNFNQSQSEVKQNQSKTRITFDSQLKTALKSFIIMFWLALNQIMILA